jgi:hypothetical protein
LFRAQKCCYAAVLFGINPPGDRFSNAVFTAAGDFTKRNYNNSVEFIKEILRPLQLGNG